MSKKKRKLGRKVALPTDRDGTPIHIGDWLAFDDGPFRVDAMTYLGDDFWYATDMNEELTDNLSAGKVISLSVGCRETPKKRKGTR